MFETLILILDSTLRLSTPLLLACLAGLYSERSGVVDIGLEGKMLGAAFGAGAVAYLTASAWAGLAAGIAVAVGLALVHGFASITNRGNQIVSGVAINFLAAGLTALLGQAWFRQGGRTPPLPEGGRFLDIVFPFAEELRAVPVVGPIYAELLSGHNVLVYAAFLAVPLTWWALYRTRFGLRLRAVGENPAAVDTAGISVVLLRYRAVILCGVLCGIAGAYLSIAQSSGFIKDMTAGKGFIALAALIFAKWRPLNAMFACLLFGFLDAVAIRLQGQPLPGIGEVPVQVFQALPYILTVILLAGFIGKAIPPRASGIPYLKERT
ncbi:ABC transporter permease [Polymorphum gilvum]|uniref:Sugar ABC transporter, permease protein n=1 Tax=Polymorphum gilvum (strain LMG 25793 / CGMCC 1.9160 / SL003B-26A1) TaxID=991905 RepID=F2J2T6_POLGS|nr:ABC transporter permease [Polymorphum gilvum]ADZ72110.1 Sugar ABC transporter, permease protein [Polymorphum gilvum SL003B-26A1]